MTEVVIFGAAGLGRLVLDILLQNDRYRPVAFLDSDPAKHGTTVDGLTVLGGMEQLARLRQDEINSVIVAIGDCHERVKIAESLTQQDMNLVSAIHPLASIAPSADLGRHLIIGARVMICVHAQIANHCVLSAGAIVEHDNRLECGVFLHPAARLAGGVSVGAYGVLGIGSCVIPYRKVGEDARVEPGSVVIRDVLAGMTVGGAPAVRIKGGISEFIADPYERVRTASLSR